MDVSNISRQVIISALPLLVAITFHELSHGFVAYKLGDPTAKFTGRLTLNPLVHIDPFGTVLLPLLLIFMGSSFVFGYAKPIPINPMNFKSPKRDMAISAAAGPVTNILLAVASLLILKFIIWPLASLVPENVGIKVLEPSTLILRTSIMLNIWLAAFNLIPVPPLDGGRVLVGLLPNKQSRYLSRIEPFGMIIVIVLIYTGIADIFITPLAKVILYFLRMF